MQLDVHVHVHVHVHVQCHFIQTRLLEKPYF
jgi:hypothetical protein